MHVNIVQIIDVLIVSYAFKNKPSYIDLNYILMKLIDYGSKILILNTFRGWWNPEYQTVLTSSKRPEPNSIWSRRLVPALYDDLFLLNGCRLNLISVTVVLGSSSDEDHSSLEDQELIMSCGTILMRNQLQSCTYPSLNIIIVAYTCKNV
ncbi:hypothetical protein QTP88_022842 [Uroleucon formosanum]